MNDVLDNHLLIVSSFSGPDGQFYRTPKVYRGLDAVDHLLTALLEEERAIFDMVKNVTPMIFTNADRVTYNQATDCHICQKALKGDKVRQVSIF